MSAVEAAIEKVKRLPEDKARKVLDLIAELETLPKPVQSGTSASALGFARRYREQPRSTADWINELREGER